MSIEVGSIVEGKVTGITNFGAFVELGNGKTGLVHISEVADAYVKDINDFLKQNDVVKVKVINVSDGKIGLSIKQADPNRTAKPAPSGGRPPRGGGGGGQNRRRPTAPLGIEEKLSRFLKDSDERQQALRKSQDSKRGGRGAR